MTPEPERESLPLALEIIRREHDDIMASFAACEDAITEERRESARMAVLDVLERHLDLEDEVLHPAMKRVGKLSPVHNLSIDQHARLRGAITEARAFDITDARLEPALKALRELFAHHRDDEEGYAFREIAYVMGDDLPALANELEEVRERLMGAYGV